MVLLSNQGEGLTSEQLIKSGLDDQVNAITGYENVIWKLRAGYLLVLNGVLALVLGRTETAIDICQLNFSNIVSLFSTILGISLTFFFIDFVYVRKKLKFMVARRLLINLACASDFDLHNEDMKKRLVDILHIVGETRLISLPDDDSRNDYKEKRNWNLFRVLLPIYAAIPLLSIGTYFLCHLPLILKWIWH
jgi:hypothetical protein